MKTTVGALKLALSRVQKAMHAQFVTLQVAGSALTVHATNGPQGCAKARLAVEGGSDFIARIDGSRLAAVLGGAEVSQPCEIKATKDAVRFKFGQANIRLLFANDEATLFDESLWQGATAICQKINGDELRAAFERVTPFAARNDVRYYLNGVLLTARRGTLSLVATNGLRLAWCHTSIPADLPDSILPETLANAISTAIDPRSEVQICTVGEGDSRGVGFRSEDFEMLCPVIAGVYPKYESVIPNAAAMGRVMVGRKEALRALGRIASAAENKGGSCFVRVAIKDGEFRVLTVDSESSDVAELEARAEIPMELGFQPKLLIQAIEAVQTDLMSFLYTQPSETVGKVLIRDAEGEGWGVIVMPARV